MSKLGRVPKFLTKDDILRAMKVTRSNFAAARYLHVSYPTYKKYATMYTDKETGKNLLEVHKNQSGKGIPKYLSAKGKVPPLVDLMEGRVSPDNFSPQKIKQRLLFEALIEERCYKCGFDERRVVDAKIPLILQHKDGNKRNWNLTNLEMLCYNCSFLYATSPISEKEAEAAEDYVEKRVKAPDWELELDDAYIEHLQSLGLYSGEEEQTPGNKYIDYEQ